MRDTERAKAPTTMSSPGRVMLLLGLLFSLNLACSNGPATGPGRIHLDRDVCARCAMVISEPLHAAQVRGRDGSGRGKLYLFDDLGCAVLFLEEGNWTAQPEHEFWVADHESGAWLPARTASYVKGIRSPMDFGLGATPDPRPGSLSFDEVPDLVHTVQSERGKLRGSKRRRTP